MSLTDAHGLALTGASDAGRAAYESALAQLQCYRADPLATIDGAIAADPGFAMAHAMRAWLHLLGTEPAGFCVAEESHLRAAASAATAREKGHVAAIGALLAGDWRGAGRILEDVTLAHPHDGLALLAGHQIDFFTGDARMLRDRVARALPAWDEGRPGYHALLGMHAFGLEETGHYAAAERAGRRGVELEPRDGWSQHAVAHVLEMQNRAAEGVAWMRASDAWAEESFFAVHNFWHLALYHLEIGEIEATLDLYDSRIAGSGLVTVIDLVDASAMLWRLSLRGVDCGGRRDVVADRWGQSGQPGLYAFNDFHMTMALLGERIDRRRKRPDRRLRHGRPDRLTGVDASRIRDGDQAFAFLGTSAFSGASGQLRIARETDRSLAQADLDGDRLADFTLELDGAFTVKAAFFLL